MNEFDLEAARREYPLPDDIPDQVVNRATLARGLDVSENTVSKYLADGMPCLTVGGNGRDYEFQLGDCYAWRMARDADLAAKRRAGDAAAAQLALVFRNDDEGGASETAGLSAREIAEESDADFRRHRAAEQRRELVRTSRVRELFEDVLVEFRTQVTTLVDFSELEFSLTPDQVEVLERRCDNALMQARQKLEQKLGDGEVTPLRGPDRQEGLPLA